MTFREAVENTPDIATGYKTGLNALGQDRSKVSATNPRQLNGSVDIDSCTKERYPNENRWDYALSYNDKVYFVEVHPAKMDEIDVMLRKLQWLKDWLVRYAPHMNALEKALPAYYWIQSGKYSIPKTAPQYRKISQNGLVPRPRLVL
jgi:hypothetical protein